MTKHIGRLVNAGIGKESDRGTLVAAAYWLPLKSPSGIEDKREVVFNDSALGVIVENNGSEIITEWSEGDLEALIGSSSFGLILLALLGTVNSALAAGESVVYDHTYTLQNDAQHDSLTIEIDEPNKDRRFGLCMINSLTINFEKGKLLDFTVNFMGKKAVTGTISASYAAETIFRPQDFGLKLDPLVSGLTAASLVPIETFSITFEKNVEADYVLGNKAPQDILNKNFKISGEFSLIYDASTYEDLAVAGTDQAMRISMVNTDVDLGVVTTNPGLTFDLEPCALTEVAFDGGLGDIKKHTITFEAKYNLATSKIIDNLVLTNLAVSY